MYKLFLIIVLSLVINTAFANDINNCVKVIENKYQTTNAISAKFTQTTYITLTKQNVIRNGLFYFQKIGKFRIEYLPPFAKIYSSDGKYLYIYSGDGSDLITEELNDKTIPSAVYTFLKGFENLSKYFEIKKSESYEEKVNLCTLSLTPKKKTSFDSLDVLFGKNGLLNEIIINNKSGNRSHYKFSNIQTKTNLSDELFVP